MAFFLFNVFKYLENLRALDPLVLEEQAVVPCICREFDPCPLERATNGRNQWATSQGPEQSFFFFLSCFFVKMMDLHDLNIGKLQEDQVTPTRGSSYSASLYKRHQVICGPCLPLWHQYCHQCISMWHSPKSYMDFPCWQLLQEDKILLWCNNFDCWELGSQAERTENCRSGRDLDAAAST